jgi:hypothetical protein
MWKDDLEDGVYRWENNINTDIEEQRVRMGMNWISLPS